MDVDDISFLNSAHIDNELIILATHGAAAAVVVVVVTVAVLEAAVPEGRAGCGTTTARVRVYAQGTADQHRRQ